jgi:hypothetical protein
MSGGCAVIVRRLLPLLFVVALVAAACGGGEDQPSGAAAGTSTSATTTTTEPSVTATHATATAAPAITIATTETFTFRAMTIKLRPQWNLQSHGGKDQEVEVQNGRPCFPSLVPGERVCPGFSLLGPRFIAEANQGQGPYSLDNPVVFHSDLGPCPSNVKLDQGSWKRVTEAPAFQMVGSHRAHFRVWRMTCQQKQDQPKVDGKLPTFEQRVWYLPQSEILVYDDWLTRGLLDALTNARWA